MADYEDKRPVAVNPERDVIVVGGGIAGIAAAVSASRCGADVLLIEKGVQLGGLATVGLINWYEPLCDGEGTQMVYGIAEELIRLAVQYGMDNLPEEWKCGCGKQTSERYASRFSPTIFSMALDEYMEENGAAVRLDTLVVSPVMEGNLCRGILAESIGGREFFPARAVIDASGDAVVCQRAGMPVETGENFLTYSAHGIRPGDAIRYLTSGKTVELRRKWWSVGADLNGQGHPEGMKMFRGDTADEITEFVLTGRKMLFEKIKNEPKEDREILTLPGMPQLRKIRRIVGAYTFDGSEEGQEFPDAIGSCGDFRTRGRRFQLPRRILYHEDFSNLFACGRIVSASGDGWEITRVIPVCALTGEAAGRLAAEKVRGEP